MTPKTIISQIKKELKKNGEISPKKHIQLFLLIDTLNTYYEAERLLNENGFMMSFNGGKTLGQNPMLKVKLDNLKMIIKLIKEILDDVEENDDTDDFIANLLK